MLLTVITSLGTVMMPRIAKLYADGEKKHIKEYMYRTFRFVFLMGCPLILGLISISNNFVPLFFGEGYEPVIQLINITSLIILFIGFSNVTGSQYLLSTKRQKEFTTSVVCGAIVNATLNFILIPIYKAMGASIATVIAELTVTCVQLFFVRKDFSILKIFKNSIKYIISAAIMFAVTFTIACFIKSRMICVFTQAFVGAGTYFICLIIFRDVLVKELIGKVTGKIFKRR